MSRRPLGAGLPPDVRLVALEARIRDYHDVVDDELVAAIYAIDTGRDMASDAPITPDRAVQLLRAAFRSLQDLRERPIRAPRNGDAGASVSGRRR